MAPKKHAKKNDKKKPKQHSRGKEARRAFEHLSRVEVLSRQLETEDEDLQPLLSWAQEAYRAGDYKTAAELLRAAEHLSFAALAGDQVVELPEAFLVEVHRELDRLQEQMEERTVKNAADRCTEKLRVRVWRGVAAAIRKEQWHRALELARGAEALTHGGPAQPKALVAGHKQRQLTA
jgi:hypothetical protein